MDKEKVIATTMMAAIITGDSICGLIEELIDLSSETGFPARPLLLSLKDSMSQIVDEALEDGEFRGKKIK